MPKFIVCQSLSSNEVWNFLCKKKCYGTKHGWRHKDFRISAAIHPQWLLTICFIISWNNFNTWPWLDNSQIGIDQRAKRQICCSIWICNILPLDRRCLFLFLFSIGYITNDDMRNLALGFNRTAYSMRSLVYSFYSYSYDFSGSVQNNIGDGGSDMFDDGNKVNLYWLSFTHSHLQSLPRVIHTCIGLPDDQMSQDRPKRWT